MFRNGLIEAIKEYKLRADLALGIEALTVYIQLCVYLGIYTQVYVILRAFYRVFV